MKYVITKNLKYLKNTTMGRYKRNKNQAKILEGMDKIYEKLIEYKKRINGEIVIIKNNKIVRIKP